jgi:1-acyl-sn-glycerol-3-phosphate acyltransferase
MPAETVFLRGHLSPRNVDRLQRFFGFLFSIFAEIRVTGLERLPPGPCLVCSNHLSRFDGPLLFALLRGRALTAFAADTYRQNPFFRRVVESIDTIWVHRGAIGPSTLKTAVQALREGRTLGVAPEGTCSRTHALQAAKPGAAALAVTAQVPIVPVAVTNTENLAPAITRLRSPFLGRVPVTVTFGQPFTLPPIERGARAARLDEYTTEIMCRIAALLPERYHGVYAAHPRLRELLAAATE